MTSSAANLRDNHTTSTDDRVETADEKCFPIAGYGRLHLEVDHDTGNFTGTTEDLKLQRVAHVPQLENNNLLSVPNSPSHFTRPLEMYFAVSTIKALQGPRSITFRRLHHESELHEIKTRRRPATPERNNTPTPNDQAMHGRKPGSKPDTQDITVLHEILGHPSEEITRETAKMAGMQLTGEWRPCTPCSESRVRRFAVPTIRDTCADTRAGRFVIDLAEPFADTSFCGSRYAMLCVDDYNRLKIIRFLKKQDGTIAALEDILATHITLAGIKVGIIRTDGGGDLKGKFQDLLNKLGIMCVGTPPHTPQHNGAAERALGLLRNKTAALLCSLKEGKSDRLWAGAMQYTCDKNNKSVTSPLGRRLTPYELWFGQKLSSTGILPFGTVGYLRRDNPPHKLNPHGNKCTLLGTAMDRPSQTYRVRDLTTRSVVLRSTVLWHPSKPPAHHG
ncbi:unnamed protein product, partial [Sphacelaria rigidula]